MANKYLFIINNLFSIYDRVMLLKLFVDSSDNELHTKYLQAAEKHNNKLFNNPHHIDAGFDLYAPGKEPNNSDALPFYGSGYINKLDTKVCCSAKIYTDSKKVYNTGYYMHPRSSLSKTPLRLANSTGIIDSGYRGHLIGMFDVIHSSKNQTEINAPDFYGAKYERYLQICAPSLVPIVVEVVCSMEELGEETERGHGGFGSTGR
jgi:dUTP pyrophosphatase